MDVSFGSIFERLLNFRAWDSTGKSFKKRGREAVNVALERLAGDVPEALIPDEEHTVLYPDVVGTDDAVKARLKATADTWVLEFTTPASGVLAGPWYPLIKGEWDGRMHLEIKDPDGVWHRRQSREWWSATVGPSTVWRVSLDREWRNVTDTLMEFRIHQPEFFVRDDVMRILEPARIWDDTRREIWAIDTAGAHRQDMVDYRGDTRGRPYRMWRGRHFHVQAPTSAPTVEDLFEHATNWAGPEYKGSFRICYTYVWGIKDAEWQPGHPGNLQDPMWESAPSPEVIYTTDTGKMLNSKIRMRATNIDAMQNFAGAALVRHGKSGFRIRFYVARDSVNTTSAGLFDNVEADGKFYPLAEVDPTEPTPTASYVWDGSVTPDYHRPLRHSTGYYAYKVYPHQDARYELDFRVLRLPKSYVDDQDTAPLQRDAVPVLMELSLYYLSLMDGVDQGSANIHLARYEKMVKRFRASYANPGKSVEPKPLGGYRSRGRLGVFANE